MSVSTVSIWEGRWEEQAAGNHEVELLQDARRGDARASEELFLNYLKGSHSIRTLLRKALANPADREEMLHEIYMALVCGSHMFRGEARLSTYVYQVARITIFQKYRRENTLKRRRLAVTLSEHEDIPDSNPNNPETAFELKQNRILLERMIHMLPGAYRDVLRMRILQDFSYEEIANEMHLPMNTVSTKIHKGKKLLAALGKVGKRFEWKD